MAYKYKTKKAKRSNYGSYRATSKIKYAVVHYTGNDGDTDEANANYFANNEVGASAHYFIDDDSITQSVSDTYVAWSVGSIGLLDQGSPYAKKGAKYWGKCTNTNSLSFELCDTIDNNKLKCSKKTRANAAAFIAKKMDKYDIPMSRLIRHFDVNGKLCPIYWVTNDSDWLAFKAEVQTELNKLKKTTTTAAAYSGTFPALPSKGYLCKGDKGNQVKNLQRLLNWCLDLSLDVDGVIGNLTVAAIETFQEKYGLTVDGEFGKKSLAKAKAIKK